MLLLSSNCCLLLPICDFYLTLNFQHPCCINGYVAQDINTTTEADQWPLLAAALRKSHETTNTLYQKPTGTAAATAAATALFRRYYNTQQQQLQVQKEQQQKRQQVQLQQQQQPEHQQEQAPLVEQQEQQEQDNQPSEHVNQQQQQQDEWLRVRDCMYALCLWRDVTARRGKHVFIKMHHAIAVSVLVSAIVLMFRSPIIFLLCRNTT